jgi:hypothetical protein
MNRCQCGKPILSSLRICRPCAVQIAHGFNLNDFYGNLPKKPPKTKWILMVCVALGFLAIVWMVLKLSA